MDKPEESLARQLEKHMLIEDYGKQLDEDGAEPIIVIGKSPGEDSGTYRIYSVSDDPELLSTTLIFMAVKVAGLSGVRDVVAEMIYERNRNA